MQLNLYDEFWFKVNIQSAKGVYSVACDIDYPPQLLAAVLDEEGSPQAALGTFFSNAPIPPVITVRLEDDTPGRMLVAIDKLDEAASAGAGSLFEILFRCVGTGEGEIRFAQSRIRDENFKTSPSQWASAKVNVVGINLVNPEIVPRGLERQELGVHWEIAG